MRGVAEVLGLVVWLGLAEHPSVPNKVEGPVGCVWRWMVDAVRDNLHVGRAERLVEHVSLLVLRRRRA